MKNWYTFEKHVLDSYPQEACGYIVDNVYYPLENVHSDPVNNFMLTPEDSLKLAKLDKGYKLIHSHTMESYKDDPRTPSLLDMRFQETTKVEWLIVHCDGENISEPISFGPPTDAPLVGRVYISNITDCFTLVRDFFYQRHGIDLGIHPRPANWEEWNQHYIDQNFTKIGFQQVVDIRAEDVLVYALGTTYPNHLGICIGEDKLLHHLARRTSTIDTISKWNKQLVKVLRRVND